MNKMYRINLLFAFVLGFMASGVMVYASYKIHAREVSFAPENENFKAEDVNSAINTLYEKIDDNQIKLLDTVGTVFELANKYSDKKTYTSTENGKFLFVSNVQASGWLDTGMVHTVTSNNPQSEVVKLSCHQNFAVVYALGNHSETCVYTINNVLVGDIISLEASAPLASDASGYNSLQVSYQVYKMG